MRHLPFLLTGTSTEVGKTYIGRRLLSALGVTGNSVGAMKPFESGCQLDAEGQPIPADALELLAGAGNLGSLDEICPYRFVPAVSPATAAEWAGVEVDLAALDTTFQTLRERHDLLLVEGAGGFLSPLTAELTVADLALRWELPVLVVVPNVLGCLNHALLTLEAIDRRGLRCLGVIFNHPPERPPLQSDDSVNDNPERLQQLSGVRVLGKVMRGFGLGPPPVGAVDPEFIPLAEALLAALG